MNFTHLMKSTSLAILNPAITCTLQHKHTQAEPAAGSTVLLMNLLMCENMLLCKNQIQEHSSFLSHTDIAGFFFFYTGKEVIISTAKRDSVDGSHESLKFKSIILLKNESLVPAQQPVFAA